jgi:phosphonate transport system substrate-binding protein
MTEVDKPEPVVSRRGKFWFLALVSAAALAAVLFLAVGRGQSSDVIKVNLDETTAVAPMHRPFAGVAHGEPDDVLTVAIAGVLSPSLTLEHYQELVNYMGQTLNRQTVMLLKPTYAEINDLLRGQRADLAFVCSLAYVEGSEEFGMEFLAAPRIEGETVYYSYLIVPTGSSVTALEDLKGASFAFADPLSNSGHLAPTYQLHLLGEAPASFFGRYYFTYNHDNSIAAVADGLVDGAAVDSLVYEQMLLDDPEIAAKTQIVARWGPFGIPPVVVNPWVGSELKQQLRDFFLNLQSTAEGLRILEELAVDRFVDVPDESYDSIREMASTLGW